MNIYLKIVVVLCASGAIHTLKPNPTFTVTELNHIKTEERRTQMECKFELSDGETLTKVSIQKKLGTPLAYVTFYERAGPDADPKVTENADLAAATIIPNKDKGKYIVEIKAAKTVQGQYQCYVESTGTTGGNLGYGEFTVKDKRETVSFNIRAEGSKDDAKDKFESGNKLNAALEYELADTAGVFTHAEFKKDDLLYFNLKLEGTTATPEPQEAAKDKGVKKESVVDGKLEGTKITVSIKDAYKETEGKYNVIFYYKEKSDGTELHFTSNDVQLHYTGGAASTMISFASISTLLLAFAFVRSNL